MTQKQPKKKQNGTGIPRHEIEALAECLLPEIRKFFESEEDNVNLPNGRQNKNF